MRPLRELRRGLKTAVHGAPAELAAAVRGRIKTAELDAEHVEQLILGQHLPGGSGAPDPAGRGALARQNTATLLAVASALPRSAFDFTQGTVLPVLNVPDQVDRVLNASLKDPGYCRGAITSPIWAE